MAFLAAARLYTLSGESVSLDAKAEDISGEKAKKVYKAKPYEQMAHSGERVQVDVKVVPRNCIAGPDLRLFQHAAIEEFSQLRFLAAYPEQSTYLLFSRFPSQPDGVVCTPRHNGKVDCSRREAQKRFYYCSDFYSLDDFAKQLTAHHSRSNKLPMKPPHRFSPIEFTVHYI